MLKFCPLPTELLHSPQELTPEPTLMLLSHFGFLMGEVSLQVAAQLLTRAFALVSECFPTPLGIKSSLPMIKLTCKVSDICGNSPARQL